MLAGLGECKEGRVELIGENVHGPAVTEVQDVILRGGGADLRFQYELGFGIVRTGVAARLGIAGINDGDFAGFALDGVNETGLLALYEWGQPGDSQDGCPGRGAVDAPDEPFLVADRDAGTWGVRVLLSDKGWTMWKLACGLEENNSSLGRDKSGVYGLRRACEWSKVPRRSVGSVCQGIHPAQARCNRWVGTLGRRKVPRWRCGFNKAARVIWRVGA